MSEITNIHQEIWYLLDKMNKSLDILEENIFNSRRRDVDKLDAPTEAIHSVPVVVVETAKSVVEMVDESAPKEVEEGILLDVRTRSVLDVRTRTSSEDEKVIQSAESTVFSKECQLYFHIDPFSVYYTPLYFIIADLYALEDPLSCGVLILSYHVIIWKHGSKRFVFQVDSRTNPFRTGRE